VPEKWLTDKVLEPETE